MNIFRSADLKHSCSACQYMSLAQMDTSTIVNHRIMQHNQSLPYDEQNSRDDLLDSKQAKVYVQDNKSRGRCCTTYSLFLTWNYDRCMNKYYKMAGIRTLGTIS